MASPEGPPELLFIHEWWLELRDDLKLAGVLFGCATGREAYMPPEVKDTMFERATAGLVAAHDRQALPPTPQQIIYGIWFEPVCDWQPVLGPVLDDRWLVPLRDGATEPDRSGVVQIVRVARTDDDRKADPLPGQRGRCSVPRS